MIGYIATACYHGIIIPITELIIYWCLSNFLETVPLDLQTRSNLATVAIWFQDMVSYPQWRVQQSKPIIKQQLNANRPTPAMNNNSMSPSLHQACGTNNYVDICWGSVVVTHRPAICWRQWVARVSIDWSCNPSCASIDRTSKEHALSHWST